MGSFCGRGNLPGPSKSHVVPGCLSVMLVLFCFPGEAAVDEGVVHLQSAPVVGGVLFSWGGGCC